MPPKNNSDMPIAVSLAPYEPYMGDEPAPDWILEKIKSLPSVPAPTPPAQPGHDEKKAADWLEMLKRIRVYEKERQKTDVPNQGLTESPTVKSLTDALRVANEQIKHLTALVTSLEKRLTTTEKSLTEVTSTLGETSAKLDEYVRRNPGSKFRIVS